VTDRIVGLKLLAADGGSLNCDHGRVMYPEGEWIDVPGLGAFVAISDGIFSGGAGPLLAFMECDLASETEMPAVEGVRCFRRVRRLRREEERLEALHTRIRWIATVWRATDQSVLEQIVRDSTDSYVRQVTVRRITDQSVLERIACEDEDWQVREAAVYGITDLSVLERIADDDNEWSVRHVATCRIKQLKPRGDA
jgi:hypothetical protein